MKKRIVSLLLCLIMALSLIPTAAFATEVETQSGDFAVLEQNRKPPKEKTYGHIDVRVAGTLTITKKVNGVATGTQTVNVTVSNVSATVNGQAVTNFNHKPGTGDENEWHANQSGLKTSDTITISCTLKINSSNTIVPFTKTYTMAELEVAVQECPAKSGFDFDITAEQVEDTITKTVGFFTANKDQGLLNTDKEKVTYDGLVVGTAFPETPTTNAKDGYEFDGWYAADATGKRTGTEKVTTFPTTVTDDAYYVAVWKTKAPTTGTLTITKNVVGLPFDKTPIKEFEYFANSDTLFTLTVAETTTGAITATNSKTLNIGTYDITEAYTGDREVNGYTLTTTYTVNGTAVDSLDDVAIEGNKTTTVVITDTYTQDNDIPVRIPIAKKVTVAQGSFHPTDATMPDFEFVAKIGDTVVGRKTLTPTEDETTHEWAATGYLSVTIPATEFVDGKATVTITEIAGTVDNWSYDSSIYTVEAKKDGNYNPDTIKKNNKAADEIVFNNTYDKPYGVLTIVKKLDGAVADRDMTFWFDVMQGNDTIISVPVEVLKDGNSGETYVALPLGEYTIGEVTCPVEPYGYMLTGCVIDYGENASSVTIIKGKEVGITVTNKYEKLPAATEKITIVKKVEIANGSIQPTDATMPTFQFVAKVGNTQVGNLSLKPVKDASGNWKIRGEMDITIPYELFDKENSYKATVIISEVAGNATGWTYDTKTYALDVYYDSPNYEIQNAPEKIESDDICTFVNRYNYTYTPVTPPITPIRRQPTTTTKPVQSVKTGDMGIALYAVTSLLSLGGTALVIKKRKDEE